MLGFAGATAATIGGYLGGHLVSGRGIGVDANRDRLGPDDWTAAIDASAVRDDAPVGADVDGTAVMLVRHDGRVLALSATCPHRGAPLEEGTIVDDCIECPWHGSRFRLGDGALVRGPSATPLPAFEVRERDGRVEVRRSRAAMVCVS
jgi:nitrite reductase/ring-hydroxylating ferredoxin subunit